MIRVFVFFDEIRQDLEHKQRFSAYFASTSDYLRQRRVPRAASIDESVHQVTPRNRTSLIPGLQDQVIMRVKRNHTGQAENRIDSCDTQRAGFRKDSVRGHPAQHHWF
jgi:hypothetical protein